MSSEDIKKDEPVELNIDQTTLYRVLMGSEYKIPCDCLFDYFLFFKKQKMVERQYLMVREVELLTKVPSFVNVWKKVAPFDGKKPENEVFFDGLKNGLKRYEKDIKLKKELYDSEGKLLEILENYQHKNVRENEVFKSKIRDFPANHQELSRKNLREKYKTKERSNIVLVSNDNVEFKAHQEIIIWKSNFFFQLFKERGREEEWKKTGKIHLFSLCEAELGCILRYIYTEALSSTSLKILFLLFNHCMEYRESRMKLYLVDLILKELSENGKVEENLKENGEFLTEKSKICLSDWLVGIIDSEKFNKIVGSTFELLKISCKYCSNEVKLVELSSLVEDKEGWVMYHECGGTSVKSTQIGTRIENFKLVHVIDENSHYWKIPGKDKTLKNMFAKNVRRECKDCEGKKLSNIQVCLERGRTLVYF